MTTKERLVHRIKKDLYKEEDIIVTTSPFTDNIIYRYKDADYSPFSTSTEDAAENVVLESLESSIINFFHEININQNDYTFNFLDVRDDEKCKINIADIAWHDKDGVTYLVSMVFRLVKE